METPEEIVARYFECLRAASYDEAVALMAPACIRRFVENEAPNRRPFPTPTLDDYLERDPRMPREVAEYRVSQAAALPPRSLSDYFAGVTTEQELETLGDRELYARYLEATDTAARCRRQIDQLIERHPQFERQLQEVRSRQGETWMFQVLGSVRVHDRALVLFEYPRPDQPEELRWEPTPNVAVLRQIPEGWRLAKDPNPYSGMGVMVAPIRVTDEHGDKIWLDLSEPV